MTRRAYWKHHEFTSQFEGAERIAKQWGLSARGDRRLRQALPGSRRRGLAGRIVFASQILPVEAPELDDERKPLETTTTIISRDEGLRETSLDGRARRACGRTCPKASTPPALRRRSPTAPPRCCS